MTKSKLSRVSLVDSFSEQKAELVYLGARAMFWMKSAESSNSSTCHLNMLLLHFIINTFWWDIAPQNQDVSASFCIMLFFYSFLTYFSEDKNMRDKWLSRRKYIPKHGVEDIPQLTCQLHSLDCYFHTDSIGYLKFISFIKQGVHERIWARGFY